MSGANFIKPKAPVCFTERYLRACDFCIHELILSSGKIKEQEIHTSHKFNVRVQLQSRRFSAHE
jgi:hypothetical protein